MTTATFLDPLFTDFFNSFNFQAFTTASTYPPYNLLMDGERVAIEMAVAGFTRDRLSISIENGFLVVKGEAAGNAEATEKYVHRGIANRAFTQKFDLQDKLKVEEVTLRDGMLRITMERIVPEYLKPRKLEIKALL